MDDYILFNKRETQQLRRALEATGGSKDLTPEFGKFIEKEKKKDPGTLNDRGDYTPEEMLRKAYEFLDTKPKRHKDWRRRQNDWYD